METLNNDQNWNMTSAVGKIVLPFMSSLAEKLPKMLGAVLCTADGFNICSIGLDDMDVGKMASLTSSMCSMGNAVVGTLAENVKELNNEQKKEVLLTIDNYQVAIVEVKHPNMDNLVLLVAVKDTQTGVLFMNIRKIVDMLEKKFDH